MWELAGRNAFIPLDSTVAGYEKGVPEINGSAPLFIIRTRFHDGVQPGK